MKRRHSNPAQLISFLSSIQKQAPISVRFGIINRIGHLHWLRELLGLPSTAFLGMKPLIFSTWHPYGILIDSMPLKSWNLVFFDPLISWRSGTMSALTAESVRYLIRYSSGIGASRRIKECSSKWYSSRCWSKAYIQPVAIRFKVKHDSPFEVIYVQGGWVSSFVFRSPPPGLNSNALSSASKLASSPSPSRSKFAPICCLSRSNPSPWRLKMGTRIFFLHSATLRQPRVHPLKGGSNSSPWSI